MISAISIKDRLKNQAEAKGKIFQNMRGNKLIYEFGIKKHVL